MWDTIISFTRGTWADLETAKVASQNITSRYPFLKYVELFTATGGCKAGFKDPNTGQDCPQWMHLDAPSWNGTYDWSQLLRATDNIRAAGLFPYVVTGNVPVDMSSSPRLGVFGVNIKMPKNLSQYKEYIQSFALAALSRYGTAELREWKWGVLTEYNNPDWFDESPTSYLQLYDWTVCGLQDALREALGPVGAHGCSLAVCSNAWNPEALLEHVVHGTNFCTGKQGTKFDFWSNSYYAAVPEGSELGPQRPKSLQNLPAVMSSMRAALDRRGLLSVSLGIDEGRILTAPGGIIPLMDSRAVGPAYMAAWDALMFFWMLESGSSWYARWAVNTNAANLGSSEQALDSASTQTARLTHRMAGSRRVPVVYTQNAPDPLPGLGPGPMMGSTHRIEVVVGLDEANLTAYVLMLQFSGDLEAITQASAELNLCGLPSGQNAVATEWVVDGEHCTFWSAWEADVASHGASWPAGKSILDEGAPQDIRGAPGWEWVAQEWPKYKALAELTPNATDIPVLVSARGCATLSARLAAHSVVLYEIKLNNMTLNV
eukprot:TRINITY_DN60404_c0_g1_i1.p1 TRINITY_DN60404_c0_g1~~TRINITY_DN60404_c0_g1_i1.p1  ORF type:complete len:600 (+),score=60.71 TRINITY_DN60404_c0_g1_i1:168-1802(+)